MRPALHPACAAFPALPDAELHKLADDIKQNGLLEPITLMTDGSILDGRSRWDACEISGVEPRTVVYDGDDPIRFVIAKNERRRHLTPTERAFIAEELANLANGMKKRYAGATLKRGAMPLTVDEAAKTMNVGETMVADIHCRGGFVHR